MSSSTPFLIPNIEHHKLLSTWTFSYCIPPKSSQNKIEDWERYLHHFTDFCSFEDFYGIINSIEKSVNLPVGCRYYVFRKGIKPIWEDKANEDGYAFSVEFNGTLKPKGKYKGKQVDWAEIADECWMDLTLSILTENIQNVDKINGIEFFHRENYNRTSFRVGVWTKRLTPEEKTQLEHEIKRLLGPNAPPLNSIHFTPNSGHDQKQEKTQTPTKQPNSENHQTQQKSPHSKKGKKQNKPQSSPNKRAKEEKEPKPNEKV